MPRVALFDPCYMSALRPGDINFARHVLETLGDTVTLLDGRCCGQPAFNSGFRAEARATGRQLLKAGQPFETVVVASGSCTAMVRHYLPPLFEGRRAAGAASIASRFVDFASYVAAHPNLGRLSFRLDGVVAYHDSCHTRRELHASGAVRSLLSRIEGLEVRSLAHEEECCGFGGTFSVFEEPVSAKMGYDKVRDHAAAGAHYIVSADSSCLMHQKGCAERLGLGMKFIHIAEILNGARA